jgi:hypothetical protein
MPSVNVAPAWEALMNRDRRGDHGSSMHCPLRDCTAALLVPLAVRLAVTWSFLVRRS